MTEKTISSRVKEDTLIELQFLKKELGVNQTAVIQSAIHLLYQSTKSKKPKMTRYKMFEQAGFIGAIEAKSNLSETYKQEIDEYLKKKYK